MTIDKNLPTIQNLKQKMDGAIASLKHLFGGLRTGRASAALLDAVKVDAYGSLMPINQVATVSVPEPRMIVVQVWDKELVAATEKAILNENLGINPNTEGQMVRLPIPDLSEERRKELVKKASEHAEHTKISIRNIRRAAIDVFKKQEKDKEISEDDMRGYTNEIQKITDQYIKDVDNLLQNKTNDIMKV